MYWYLLIVKNIDLMLQIFVLIFYVVGVLPLITLELLGFKHKNQGQAK